MRLELDIGNTRVKWRLRDATAVSESGAIARADWSQWLTPERFDVEPGQVWVSSVAGSALEQEVSALCRELWQLKPWFARTLGEMRGLCNSYADPGRMGVDRWLAMLAAWVGSREAFCIVDAGSALTLDFVSGEGRHLGGYIIPGLDSMERALLSDTDRVRFGEARRDQLEPGRSTEEAVYNGILLSQAGSVFLALQRVPGTFRLYFTGGNGPGLQQVLELEGQQVPDLVLDGLLIQGEATTMEVEL